MVDIRIVAREVVATDRAVQLVLTSTDAPVDLTADGYDAGGQKTVAIEANRPGVVETVQILEAAPGVSAASFALQVFAVGGGPLSEQVTVTIGEIPDPAGGLTLVTSSPQVAEGKSFDLGVVAPRAAPADTDIAILLDVDQSTASLDDIDDTIVDAAGLLSVTIAEGETAGRITITTVVDAERDGPEVLVFVLSEAGTTTDPIEVTITDTRPEEVEKEPARRRVESLPAPPLPDPEPSIGPLVAGSVTWTANDRTITVDIPDHLQVWLSPTNVIRLVADDTTLVSADSPVDSLSFAVPDGATRPFTVQLQGRLRNGIPYWEDIVIG